MMNDHDFNQVTRVCRRVSYKKGFLMEFDSGCCALKVKQSLRGRSISKYKIL